MPEAVVKTSKTFEYKLDMADSLNKLGISSPDEYIPGFISASVSLGELVITFYSTEVSR